MFHPEVDSYALLTRLPLSCKAREKLRYYDIKILSIFGLNILVSLYPNIPCASHKRSTCMPKARRQRSSWTRIKSSKKFDRVKFLQSAGNRNTSRATNS